jgi:hypothetical protein
MLAEDLISPITYEDCMKSVDRKKWLKAIKEEKDCLKRLTHGILLTLKKPMDKK